MRLLKVLVGTLLYRRKNPLALATSPLNLSNLPVNLPFSSVRLKYTANVGVKGIRPRKFQLEKRDSDEDNGEQNEVNLEDFDYDVIANEAMHVTRNINNEQNVFVVQPYIKWGPNKQSTSPESQLQEAEALIRSLPNWNVQISIKVALESLGKKALFGTGKLQEIKSELNRARSTGKAITCMFISKGTLSFAQKHILQSEFGIPVMDRYSIVIQILRLHATTAEAKIQVAMAEIPYIWGQAKNVNISTSRKIGYSLSDTQREILKNREKKLKLELEKIRNHRKLLRKKRKQKNYPIVAVVGYTNAGKTSLIKALTDEQTMQPRDQLFATLDVTAHAGVLPCNLEVIFMDTVGFMSDLPTGLIECFVATLEDAMTADVILHVLDLSHDNCMHQKKHVETTLHSLANTLRQDNDNIERFQFPPIINVGNKVDLLKSTEHFHTEEGLNLISSKTLAGIGDLLQNIELRILESTDRKKMTIRVKNGGPEIPWLYKNAAVINTRCDPKNAESLLVDVVITRSKLQQFKHNLGRNIEGF